MDISQKLGFDVSDALSSLRRLNDSIDSHTARLGQLDSAYNKLNPGGLSRLTAEANKAGRSLSSLSNQTKGIDALGSSIGRIAAGNLIASGIGQTTAALSDAVSGAIDFQNGLSEIQTIAPVLSGDLDGLASRVRGLSDDFNAPLGDVTEGLYQTISNQVQGTAEQFDVLSTSLKFAKTTASTTDQSVQLLTASINGFGKDASEADDIAAKWFKTIELGRTRADELSNSIGRVSKLASQVGISMEEMQAALATITISGVKTSEAITQMRGVMNGLIKPTEAMKDVLDDLGFSSGQQAIEVLGLGETLQALVESTGGSTEALAELFPRVRGLSGVLNIAGRDADKFASNLEKLRSVTAETLNEKYRLVIQTDAARATKKMNALKNFLVEDFGTAVLKTFNQVTDAAAKLGDGIDLGSISGADALSATAAAAPAATTALATYALRGRAASLAASAFGASAGALVTPLGAAAAATLAVVASVNAYNEAVEDALAGGRGVLDKAISKRLESLQESAKRQIEAEKDFWSDIGDATRQGVSDQLRAYNRGVDGIEAAYDRLRSSLSSSVGDVFGGRESIVDSLNDRAKSASEQAASVQAEQTNLQIDLEDELFQGTLDRVSAQQAYNLALNRSRELGESAADALASARNGDEKAAADDQFARALALERQAKSIASQIGSQAKLAGAERLLTDLTEQRVSALGKYGELQTKISANAKAAAAQQREALKDLRDQFSDIGDGPSLFDDQGNPLSGEDRSKAIADFQARINDFRSQAGKLDLDFSQFLGIETLASDLQSSLKDVQIDSLQFADVTAQLNQQIDSFFSNKSVQLTVDAAFNLSGEKISDPSKIFSQFAQAAKNNTTRIDLEASLTGMQVEADALANSIGATISTATYAAEGIVGTLSNGLSNFFADAPNGADRVAEAYANALQVINVSLADQIVSPEEMASVTQRVREAVEAADTNTRATDIAPVQIQSLEKAQQDMLRILELQDAIKQSGATLKALPTPELGGLNSQLSQSISQTNQLASSFLNAAAAAASISVGGGDVGATSRFFGGGIFRNSGGDARGRDNIPAVLSRGEFVVNARSNRKFAPEIQAINAGVKPAFRNSGGTVDNSITVGDVNFNGDSRGVTARGIATNLRREISRGTSRI